MSNPDLNAAASEIRNALAQSATDARKILVVTGAPTTPKSEAFKAAAAEAGLSVETLSLADPKLTTDALNGRLNKPSNNDNITYLLLTDLDAAADPALQEIEDALQARGYLGTPELWRLPRLAATAEHTPHWLPENLRTEVTMPVQLPVQAISVEPHTAVRL